MTQCVSVEHLRISSACQVFLLEVGEKSGLDLALEELRREGGETEPDADKDQAGECSQAGGC